VSWSFWLPLLVLGSSLVTATLIFLLDEEQYIARTVLNLSGAALKVVLVALMVIQTMRGETFEARLPFIPGIDLLFRADFLSLLIASLSAILWLLTTIYAIGYLEGSPERTRFFGFFSLCVTATMGIALAGNLVTFFVFYELLTVTTFPLVVHRGTGASLTAGRTYLLYTLAGGVFLLAGMAWLHLLVGTVEFTTGGAIAHLGQDSRAIAIFVLLIAGTGVKAAIVPFHGWLPQAMVAPAPVSALLHAVAVVKAGVFGVVRIIYDVYGISYAAGLGVLTPLAIVASITILYGSLRALSQDSLKRMLAFSTVSQVSYIVLGSSIVGPMATIGGLAHLVHQGLMKVTLFYCAGAIAEKLNVQKVSEMSGVGRRMPLTMLAFTAAALGMIGIPPTAGFVTKWYLGLGGLAAGQPWVVAVLVASGMLNAMYFLPVVYRAWFQEPIEPAAAAVPENARWASEAGWMLLLPIVATSLLALGAGLMAGLPISPLGLARLAIEGSYVP
jgi:multicomponent Na+:H+ antiporter subunit D